MTKINWTPRRIVTVAWHLLWYLPCVAAFSITCLLTAISYGPSDARRFWRENM